MKASTKDILNEVWIWTKFVVIAFFLFTGSIVLWIGLSIMLGSIKNGNVVMEKIADVIEVAAKNT